MSTEYPNIDSFNEWLNAPNRQYYEIVALMWILSDIQGNLAYIIRDGLRAEGRESAAEWADDLVGDAEANIGNLAEKMAKVLSQEVVDEAHEYLRGEYNKWKERR